MRMQLPLLAHNWRMTDILLRRLELTTAAKTPSLKARAEFRSLAQALTHDCVRLYQ
jgi:hypothetical protein